MGVLWAGAVCTTVIAAAGAVVGAVPKSGQQDPLAHALHIDGLRGHEQLRHLATVAAFLAVAGLIACWVLARRQLAAAPLSSTWRLAAAWSLPLLLAPPLYSADVYAYAGQGYLVEHDVDPYLYGPGGYEPTGPFSFNIDGLWRFTASPYGPLWLWLSGRLVALSGDHVVVSVYLFRLLAVLGWVGIAWAAVRLCRARGRSADGALWLAFLNPLVLLHGLAGAHNEMLMVGLLGTGLVLAVSGRTVRACAVGAAVVALAALIKIPALVALPFLPLFLTTAGARRAAVVVVGGVSAAVTALVVHLTGLGWRWLEVLSDQDRSSSVWSLAAWVPASGQRGLVVLVLVLVAIAWLAALRGGDVMWCLGLALLLLFVLGPGAQPWYLLWSLLPLAVTAGRRTIGAVAVLSAVLVLCLLPGGRSWIRPPLYGGPLVVAAVVAGGLLTVRRRTPA